MIEFKQDTTLAHMNCDPEMVEKLIQAATSAMERAVIPDITTPSEIATASFVLLDRTLRGIRKLSPPRDRAQNAKEFGRILNELIVDHGKVPN